MVRTQHDVGKDLVVRHLDVADSNTQTENLFQLELDGRTNFDELVAEVLSMGNGGGELSSCRRRLNFVQLPKVGHTLGETGTKETGNLLDQSLRGQECIVTLRKLLDELLVLVHPVTQSATVKSGSKRNTLLEVIDRHVLEVDLLGAVDVGSISENADRHARARDIGQPEGNSLSILKRKRGRKKRT